MPHSNFARMLTAFMLLSVGCGNAVSAPPKDQVTKPKKTPPGKPSSAAIKPAKPAPPKGPLRESSAPVVAATIAGNYEADGNLLTILRYTSGRPEEHLVAYLPNAATGGEYCSFFSAPSIPAGATSFNAHRYAVAGLQNRASNCTMRIKADGAKAEIVDMSPECRLLCQDPRTFANPGIMKRVPD